MAENVILVDGQDNPTGSGEKTRCHMPDGKLHRAFTALLFDENHRLALGRRAPGKMLWPGCWDGTFASHPRETETYVEAGIRRMPEELGISANLDYFNKFEYHVPYKDVGSENEICATLVGVIDSDAPMRGADGEIDAIRWVSAGDILGEIATDPAPYCPWMLIALELLGTCSVSMREKYSDLIAAWSAPETHKKLQKAIASHLTSDKWRIVNED